MIDYKKYTKLFFSIWLFMLYSVILFAQNSPYTSSGSSSPDATLSFIENKGQWPEQVLFKARLADHLTVYFEQSGWTLCMYDAEDMHHSHAHHDSDGHNHKLRGHAVKVRLPETNAIAEGVGMKEEKYNYLNFGTSSSAKNVRAFKEIIYKNLWPNIDLRFYCSPGTRLKYEFILSEGADINKIRLEYSGQESMAIENGHLVIGTSLDEITELKPIAWTGDGQQKDHLSCSYQLTENLLTFQTDEYPKESKMVIDPELVFSTYTGSLSDNWGFSATDDLDGNVYSGGIVSGGGYPVSPGAFQEEFAGNWDIAIIKYTPDGTQRLFATLLGGSYADLPHSLIVNKNNELLIFGTTGSPDFPITPSAYDTSFNGGAYISYDGVLNFPFGVDLFVARLSEDGSQLLSSTFIGGSGNDGLNYRSRYAPFLMHEIMVDENDNVYIASTTFSNDFPVKNAYQNTSGGRQDGVAFKLSSSLSTIEWSTYIGGTSKDAAYSIDVDKNDGVYISGGTCSPSMGIPASGFMPNRIGGKVDAYILKLNQTSGALENGTYFGSTEYDQAHFVRVNGDNNVFIFGQTTAVGTALIFNANYGTPNSGQFLASFNNELTSLNWSTVFGTGTNAPNISPTAFEVDICNRIYLAGCGRDWPGHAGNTLEWDPALGYWHIDYGWGNVQGTNNMEITSDAFQSKTDGKDFYIMVIDDEANALEYATYFGEIANYRVYSLDGFNIIEEGCEYGGRDHVDGGTSRFDSKGFIYQSVCASCGGCIGETYPIKPKPGAYSVTNNSQNCNNAVMRFFIDFGLMIAEFDLPEVSCETKELVFENKSQFFYNNPKIQYTWDFGDGSPVSHDENPSHIFQSEGDYEITLFIEDSSACNLKDSIVKPLSIVTNTKYDTLVALDICEGDTVEIGIPNDYDSTLTYLWNPTDFVLDSVQPKTYAFPKETTDYTLTVTEGWCQTIYNQHIEVHENNFLITNIEVTADNEVRNPICSGEEVKLNAITSDVTHRYIWSESPTFLPVINQQFNQSWILVAPSKTTRYYVKTLAWNCSFEDTSSVLIEVIPNEITTDLGDTICNGNALEIKAINNNPEYPLTYYWQPNSFVALRQGEFNPLVMPTETTDFIVSAQNSAGCITKDTVTVWVSQLDIDTYYFEQISCFGETDGRIFVSPYGVPDYKYLWENGDTVPARLNLSAGTYSVEVTDGFGCVNNAEFEITEPEELRIIDTINNSTSCVDACNGSAYIEVTGGTQPYSYLWTNGDTNAVTTNLCIGSYNASITDAHGCTTNMQNGFNIGLYERLPELNAYADPNVLFVGQTTLLHATPNPSDTITYIWSPYIWFDTNLGHTISAYPKDHISYYVIATDNYGCSKTDTVNIEVNEWKCDHPFIYIPTAFSPNNDGVNDYLKVESGVLTELLFEVYDRWGEKIFETTDVNQSWDGTYNGKPIQPQVLVYHIKATCLNQETFSEQGNITVIK